MISYSSINEDQKEIPIVEFEYDDNNEIILSKLYKKGILKSTTYKTLTENGKLTELKKENSKGKNTSKYLGI